MSPCEVPVQHTPVAPLVWGRVRVTCFESDSCSVGWVRVGWVLTFLYSVCLLPHHSVWLDGVVHVAVHVAAASLLDLTANHQLLSLSASVNLVAMATIATCKMGYPKEPLKSVPLIVMKLCHD